MSNIDAKILEKIKPMESDFFSYLESNGGILMDIYKSQYRDDNVNSAKRTYKNKVAKKLANYLKDNMDNPDDLKNATENREPNPNGYDISKLENGGDIYTLQQIKNIIPLLFLYYSGAPLITSGGGQRGGYPRCFDNVPKGMSRKKYLRLKKSKPKNKSMKIWIKENTKRRKKNHKRKVQKGGFVPCLPCLAAPAAFASAAIGGAGFMMKSSSTRTSIRNSNGKKKTKNIKNKNYKDTRGINNEESEILIDDNDFTYDMDIKRKGKKIYIDDKLYKSYETIIKAQKDFNKLIRKQKILLKEE